MQQALGWVGAAVILVATLGIGLVLALDVSLNEVAADVVEVTRQIIAWVKGLPFFQSRERPYSVPLPPVTDSIYMPEPPAPQTQAFPSPRSEQVAPQPPQPQPVEQGYRPTETRISAGAPMASSHWVLPPIADILAETDETEVSLSDIREKTHIIEETLRSLGVPVTVVEVNPGPVVTQFGLEPGYIERRDRDGKVKRVKVKVSRISALSNDLALALAASSIRIETPVPGKGIVGLEIPNNETAVVGLRGIMESEQYRSISSRLAIGFGRDVSGAAVADDLSKLPHLLIAGATGSGKSVCMNTLVACLLCRNTPDDLRMLMVDPKRVELSLYNGIPHLLAPVIVELDRVVGVLTWVTNEMDRRYKEFAKVGARNIQTYNRMVEARGERKLPYIVVFIDELADLMMVAPEDVERLICRIAQMARATGIHLVIATQRPSVDVVTGLIKANFPARIAFAVTSQIDSRVILDV
ncbi:MAG: DNA translocase FtsK, partial [Chloroflexi bacterium]|nr:DNA translocase FtsK [Chloroflexota bacterium]